MNKIIVQIAITALLLANISCSDEKEIVTEEEVTTETSFNVVNKLPENAKSISNIIDNLSKDLGKDYSKSSFGEEQINTNTSGDDIIINFINHDMMFVVYPRKWSAQDRFYYYLTIRNLSKEIYMVVDSCDNVDTFYVPSGVKLTIPGKDKAKNVVVATNEEITVEEDEDDGPRIDKFFDSCEEVMNSSIYLNVN